MRGVRKWEDVMRWHDGVAEWLGWPFPYCPDELKHRFVGPSQLWCWQCRDAREQWSVVLTELPDFRL